MEGEGGWLVSRSVVVGVRFPFIFIRAPTRPSPLPFSTHTQLYRPTPAHPPVPHVHAAGLGVIQQGLHRPAAELLQGVPRLGGAAVDLVEPPDGWGECGCVWGIGLVWGWFSNVNDLLSLHIRGTNYLPIPPNHTHMYNPHIIYTHHASCCKFLLFSESTAFISRPVADSVNRGLTKNWAKRSTASV